MLWLQGGRGPLIITAGQANHQACGALLTRQQLACWLRMVAYQQPCSAHLLLHSPDPSMAVRYSHLAPYVQRGMSKCFLHVPLYYEHICSCLSTQMDIPSFKDGSSMLQAGSNVAAADSTPVVLLGFNQ